MTGLCPSQGGCGWLGTLQLVPARIIAPPADYANLKHLMGQNTERSNLIATLFATGRADWPQGGLMEVWGGSSRQGCNPVGGSPTVSIAHVGHVAIPHLCAGNHQRNAWCKRPGRPAWIKLRWEQPGGLASVGA